MIFGFTKPKFLESSEGDSDVENDDAEHGHRGRPERRMTVVTFWQKVGCSDVDEKAAEGRKDDTESSLRDGEEEGTDDTRHRCERVHEKPAERFAHRAAVFENEIDRIDAVGEIVRQHSDCYDDTDGW